MKYFKITLISLAIIGIGISAYSLYSKENEEIKEVELNDNKFINYINQQIESIKNSPKEEFSKKKYKQTVYSIEDYYKTEKITKQWYDNLNKKTEYIYHNKFIKEANYIFSKTIWNSNDVNYLKNELNYLKKSKYITSQTALNPLNRVISDYDKIIDFISKSKQYTNTNKRPSLDEKFNELEAKSYLNTAAKLSKIQSLVKNNIDLMNGLANIKLLMLYKHIDFLNSKLLKIESQKCTTYNDYNTFFNVVCKPIFNDISDFKNTANETYGCETSLWYDRISEISTKVSEIAKDSKYCDFILP